VNCQSEVSYMNDGLSCFACGLSDVDLEKDQVCHYFDKIYPIDFEIYYFL